MDTTTAWRISDMTITSCWLLLGINQHFLGLYNFKNIHRTQKPSFHLFYTTNHLTLREMRYSSWQSSLTKIRRWYYYQDQIYHTWYCFRHGSRALICSQIDMHLWVCKSNISKALVRKRSRHSNVSIARFDMEDSTYRFISLIFSIPNFRSWFSSAVFKQGREVKIFIQCL